ncbi:MAG: AEC family transporter [Phycisphaerae bacterium]
MDNCLANLIEQLPQLPAQLAYIFYDIVLPVLLLAATGFFMQRRLGLEMLTLKRLNFYFVMPGIIYYSIVTSTVSPLQALQVVGFAVSLLAAMAVLTVLVALLRGVPRDQISVMVLTTILHNSGNFGLPLQKFAFEGQTIDGQDLSAQAATMQAYVMITQNFFTFTVGVLIAAGGKGACWRKNLMAILKFPPIYALAAGLTTNYVRGLLGETAGPAADALSPFWAFLVYVKNAFVPVALLTLGAQLALVRPGGPKYPVRWSVALRLLAGPAIGVGLVYLFGLEGFKAQMLLISTSSPTAVNCMLLNMEFDNHPDYAARAVLYSTLLSPVTVTLVIFLAQGQILPGFAMG